MVWTSTKAEIWLSSVDIAWERKFDGLTQRLNVVATIDGPMHLFASQWFVDGKIRSFKLDNVARRFVIDQSEITNLWNLAYFGGEISMSAYTKTWGLAVERKFNPDGLERIGNLAFTRSDAESYRDKWNRLYPSNPVVVINLKAE